MATACVRVCVCECAPPPPPIHLYGFIAASIALWPATHSLARALFLFYFSLAASSVLLLIVLPSRLLVTRRLLRLGTHFLTCDGIYSSLLCSNAIAVYFVLIRWSFQILNFGFDSSPGPHILLVNLAIPSPTSRAFVEKKMIIFSHVFLVYYCTRLHFEI